MPGARAAQRPELGQRVGQLAFGLAERRLEVEVARRARARRSARRPAASSASAAARSSSEPAPVALERLELRGEPRLARAGPPSAAARAASCASRRSRSSAARAPSSAASADAAASAAVSVRHRPIAPAPARRVRSRLGGRQPRGAPRASGRASRARSALASSSRGRLAGRLLLGLGGQPARLRPELAEDVLDAGEVRLGLDQLLLGPAAAALVAADAGDLLEQRPALLGPQRQRLVDHALADEQERVVGEVRRVEQVDEVAQPDPLLVEEVVVLARAVQPAAELEDLEVDRQQAVARCRGRA